jgi:hypothetical protein
MACGALCVSTPMDFGRPWVDHLPIIANSARSIVSAIEKSDTIERGAYIQAGLKTAAAFDWKLIGERWNSVLLDRNSATP